MRNSDQYIKFLYDNNIIISTETIDHNGRIDDTVINNHHNWNEINEKFNKDRYVIVDNFLKPEYVERLRKFYLFLNIREDYWKDYEAINFFKKEGRIWFPLLTNISEEANKYLKFLNDIYFQRGWAFLYNNTAGGVGYHIDPGSDVTLNVWVTPEQCLNMEKGKNGLIIAKTYNYETVDNCEHINVEYCYNRAIIFDSMYLHRSQPISTLPGHENKKINYTFLYGKITPYMENFTYENYEVL